MGLWANVRGRLNAVEVVLSAEGKAARPMLIALLSDLRGWITWDRLSLVQQGNLSISQRSAFPDGNLPLFLFPGIGRHYRDGIDHHGTFDNSMGVVG